MKVLITGNRNKDLTKYLVDLFEKNSYRVDTVSRENGWDLANTEIIPKFVNLLDNYNIFVNMFANWRFNASLLTYYVFKDWEKKKYGDRRIITIGSTTDRVRRPKTNLYHYEKLALREMSNGLSMAGVWDKDSPLLTHVSFGTMDNRAEQNPGRKTLNMEKISEYILWVLQQPKEIHINELSIDPVQR
tara:strand:+ start:264 stop:827 length:564 start_codon:yes stop_codon:yes gene_type:complete